MRYVVGGCYLSCLALNLLCFILKFTIICICICTLGSVMQQILLGYLSFPAFFWVWFILVLGLRVEGSEPETDKFMVAEVNLEFSCVCFIERFSKQRRMVRLGRVTELLTYSYSYSNQVRSLCHPVPEFCLKLYGDIINTTKNMREVLPFTVSKDEMAKMMNKIIKNWMEKKNNFDETKLKKKSSIHNSLNE